MNASERWLADGARNVRGPLALSIALGIGAGALILLQTALVVRIVNGVVFEGKTLETLRTLFVLALLAIGARVGTQYAAGRAGYFCAARIKQSVRMQLLSRLGKMGPVSLSTESSGELAGTIVDGVEALEPYYARYLPQRAIAAVLPFLVLAVAFPLDWISGIIFTATAIFIPVLMILIGDEARRRNQEQWKQLSRMGSRFLDIIQGLPTLKMFGASRRETETIRRIAEDHRVATMEVVRVAFVSSLMLELITTISIALVAVTTGFRLLNGTLHFHTAYFILLIAPEFYRPLRTLGTHYHARMSAAAAAERIYELLSPDGSAEESSTGASSVPAVLPSIEFRDVVFSYDHHDRGSEDADRRGVANGAAGPVLAGFTMKIVPGERIAVMGESGAGKSTLFSLLLGFCAPDSGSIFVGERNMVEAKVSELREHIAWLPQRPTLFPGTIADNIRIARRNADGGEVESAARSAHAHEFIERLPLKYDTLVGERGYGLSGGEVQRLALARLFLRSSHLLLLDEPGSHLDAESESLVRDAIRGLSVGKTMIVVAHRPSILSLVERVVVLADGRVIQQGEPETLRREEGPLRRLLQDFEAGE